MADTTPTKISALCICIILVMVLLWHICQQDYRTACDRKMDELKYRFVMDKLHSRKSCGCVGNCSCAKKPSPCALARVQATENFLTPKAPAPKQKKKLNPEKDVMGAHAAGDTRQHTTSGINDPLTLDSFIGLKSPETTSEKVMRNFTDASRDGEQMEGMHAPVADFERNAMVRQLHKNQEVYGEQQHDNSGGADIISELNF
jgi:hypothetical protein